MLKTESAGGVVFNQIGEVALVKNGPSFWGFPKGHLDQGEEVIAAARREIEEETGLTELELLGDLGWYERYRGTPTGEDDIAERKKIHMFLFRTTQTKLAPIDTSNPEARWVPPHDVVELLTHPKDKEFFKSIESVL